MSNRFDYRPHHFRAHDRTEQGHTNLLKSFESYREAVAHQAHDTPELRGLAVALAARWMQDYTQAQSVEFLWEDGAGHHTDSIRSACFRFSGTDGQERISVETFDEPCDRIVAGTPEAAAWVLQQAFPLGPGEEIYLTPGRNRVFIPSLVKA